MQLIYIWVEEFQNIRQSGFSFSDKYKVEVNPNLKKYEVVIEENKKNVETLLLGDNISISAIVGNNGVGKSTLLNLIRIMLFDQERIRDKNVGFSIWLQENKFVKREFCNKQVIVNGMEVENIIDEKKFSVIYYSDTLDMRHYNDDFDDGENIDCYINDEDVYNTFNEPGEEEYWSSMLNLNLRNRYMEQYNVSTIFLLKNSKNNKDKIIDFFHGEVKRHLTLYNEIRKKDDYENRLISLKVPENLTISVEFLSPKICDKVLDDNLVNYAYQNVRDAKHGGNYTEHITIYFLKDLLNIYESVIDTSGYRSGSKLNNGISSLDDIICWNLLIIHIYWLLDERKDYEYNKDDYSDVDESLKNIIEEYNNSEDVFNFCRELFETAEYMELESILSFYESLKNFKKSNGQGININFRFPAYAMSALKNEIPRPFPDIEKCVVGWNGERELKDFMNLYLEYEKVAWNVDFFSFDWGMSTGEFNLFSLFARIHSAVMRAFRGNETEIMILLDEIDSTFHPSWQQIIINELANFLKLLYPEVKFQIILSTHSPVLLSDIPLQKVVFLTGQIIEQEHKQTFAANIASLYYDSFLMKKGSIGNLAHSCIKNLINAMNIVIEENISDIKKRRKVLVDTFYELHHLTVKDFNAEQYEEKVHQIRNLINSVGEKIWKYKLNELFEQCKVVSKKNNINREFLEYIEQVKNKNGEEAVIKLLKELKEKNK